jgi:hypothetical protein
MQELGLERSPIILDECSPDEATAKAVAAWAAEVGCSLELHHSDSWRSLKAALTRIMRIARSDLLLFACADVIIPSESLAALISALLLPSRPDVVMGLAAPDPTATSLRFRAGAFQLRAVCGLVGRNMRELRPEGALWGASRAFYRDFLFPEPAMSIHDDVEIVRALSDQGGRGLTAPGALAYKMPPGTISDFARHTRRSIYAANKAGQASAVRQLSAFLRESLRDPLGAGLYLLYRSYAALRSKRYAPGTQTEQWAPSPSTKR